MTLFWVLSGLLVGIAWWFVLRPLLARGSGSYWSRRSANLAIYRDQLRELEVDLRAGTITSENFDKARRELEARVLDDVGDEAERNVTRAPSRGMAAAVALIIPAGALAIYFAVGTPGALVPMPLAGGGAPHATDAKQLEVAVERLAARLKDNPEDTQGWVMLARSYQLFGRFSESARAYARAVEREPRDAQLLADYADMLAMVQGRSLQGEPEKLIARALEVDPQNLKALALAGSVAFENKDYARAASVWERMLKLVPAGSEDARSVQANVDEARALAAPGAPKLASAPPVVASAAVSGTVTLAPDLAKRVAPNDNVFVFVRPAEGSRMPLALVRKEVRELPFRFVLDDSMAMAPGMNLSSFPQVVVGARVSKSGSATPQPGDFEGTSAPIGNTASNISVVIKNEIR